MEASDAAALFRLTQELADILDRDAPLTQALVFLRVASAGAIGADQGRIAEDLKLPPSVASRSVQALSHVHYLKDRPGFGLIERVLDPTDNRRRELRLTAHGSKAIERLAKFVPRRQLR